MKDMFGMHHNPEENVCLKYEIRAISKETQTKVESHLQEGQSLDKQYPRWLLTVGAFALATGLFLCVLMFVAKDGFVEAMKNRGYIFYIGLGIFLLGIGFIAAHLVLLRKQKKDPEVSDFLEKSDRFIKEIKDELNVPEDAKEADLLCSFVKTNSKGEEKLVQSALVNRNNVVCTCNYYFDFSFPRRASRHAENDPMGLLFGPAGFQTMAGSKSVPLVSIAHITLSNFLATWLLATKGAFPSPIFFW